MFVGTVCETSILDCRHVTTDVPKFICKGCNNCLVLAPSILGQAKIWVCHTCRMQIYWVVECMDLEA